MMLDVKPPSWVSPPYGPMKPWAEKNGERFSLYQQIGGSERFPPSTSTTAAPKSNDSSGHPEVIADELVAAGHGVKHIDSTGRTENHDPHRKLPDFIVPCHGR